MATGKTPAPALRKLYDRYVGTSPKRQAAYEEELANAQVARAIHDLRTSAKLTQAALAKLAKTTPSVISRLEDSDYQGHSLAMFRRIAVALDRRVEIRFLALLRPATGRLVARTRSIGESASGRKSGSRS